VQIILICTPDLTSPADPMAVQNGGYLRGTLARRLLVLYFCGD